MDIVVKGRNVEVPDHYRVHVSDKLARLERYDKKVIRFDVELFHEPNRRQSKSCSKVTRWSAPPTRWVSLARQRGPPTPMCAKPSSGCALHSARSGDC